MSTTDVLWHWQANLGRGVGKAEFIRNFTSIFERAEVTGAVILLQEVDEADRPEEADIIRWLAKGYTIIGMKTGVPILIPDHMDIVWSDTRLACKGLAKYTPNRYVTEAMVQLPHGTEVGLFNTHVPLLRPATLSRRRNVRQALREETVGVRNGLWVADTNTHVGWPAIVKGEKSAVNAGIDKAKVWAKGKGEVKVTTHLFENLTIDNHNAHGARSVWHNAA